MIVLTVVYTMNPDDKASVLKDLAEMTRLVKAREPGCVRYQVHESVDHADQLLLYEAYRDQESFDAHAASPYFQELVLGRIVPKLTNRQRSLWTPVD